MDNALLVTVLKGEGPAGAQRFTATFTIGRTSECELQIKEHAVSRRHVQIAFDGRQWRLEDLGSGNGTFLNGERVQSAPLPYDCIVGLGSGGPQLSLVVVRQEAQQEMPREEPVTVTVPLSPPASPAGAKPMPELASETQILRHYMEKSDGEDVGEQTLMFRRAFARAHQQKTKKYRYLIGVAALLLVVAGSLILYQKQKLQKLRATAGNIFYVMKGLELQIAKLEEVVLLNVNPAQLADLRVKREKFRGMEQEYDSFIRELDIYAKLSPEDRVIARVARTFGECEVNMPTWFGDEVKKYINGWKSTGRLKVALDRAQQRGYTPLIVRTLKENNLPPQFFFLALQESNFDERAVGPQTRFGHAKGIWQFIAPTASQFGLQVGPLYGQPVYDPQDERFNIGKASAAAAKYIKELNNGGAQASGLLVMASYNWGEGNVRQIIDQMPPNPRDRNFWRLLTIKDIPKETHDYVFSIFSAAVICEEPKLFGFDGACPSFAGGAQTAPASAPVGRPLS